MYITILQREPPRLAVFPCHQAQQELGWRSTNLSDPGSRLMHTSYSRRRGDFIYDVSIDPVVRSTNQSAFSARALNVARLADGEPVPVGISIEELGATVGEAVAKLEATIEECVQGREPSHELAPPPDS
jgi:hypothetical protein